MAHETIDEPYYRPEILGNAPYEPKPDNVRLIERANDVLNEYRALSLTPLTVRQVYYRLVATFEEYPKSDTFYQRLVSVLARARRAGMVPWDDIRDDGDTTDAPHGYDDAAGLRQTLIWTADAYKRHRQEGQRQHIIVACEAAGMVPQLARVCHDYGVAVRSAGGVDSVTAKRQLGVEIAEMLKPTVLLHVGDWDPTGLVIYSQLYHDVRQFTVEHLKAKYDIEGSHEWLEVRRIAITPQQVDIYVAEELLGEVKETTDKGRYPGLKGDRSLTCEVEALPPERLAEIVEEHLLSYTDMQVREHVLVLEAEERERLQRQIGKLRLGRHGREAAITPELARRARASAAAGSSVREIADELGVPKSTIGRALRRG